MAAMWNENEREFLMIKHTHTRRNENNESQNRNKVLNWAGVKSSQEHDCGWNQIIA